MSIQSQGCDGGAPKPFGVSSGLSAPHRHLLPGVGGAFPTLHSIFQGVSAEVRLWAAAELQQSLGEGEDPEPPQLRALALHWERHEARGGVREGEPSGAAFGAPFGAFGPRGCATGCEARQALRERLQAGVTLVVLSESAAFLVDYVAQEARLR